jgi:predicted AAA+ superfamily ATPase
MKRHPAAPILDDLLAGRRPPEGSQAAPAPLDILQQGLMPALVGYADGRIPAAHVEWWEGYVATYLERDLRRLSDVGSLPDFRRLMSLAALRAGGRLNQSELAREARLSQPTTHRYLNLLEATHLIERLPAYIGGRTARLRKSPKLHWADPGLAAFLAGFYDSESLAASREVGGVFETYVVHHLRVLADLSQPRARLFYWRAVAGKDLETDVVVEQGRRVFAFEIKMNETARYADAAGLRSFLRDNPQAIGGAVIYRGRDIVWWDEKTMALPVSLVEG